MGTTLIDTWKAGESEAVAELELSSPETGSGSIGRRRLDERTGSIGPVRTIHAPRPDDEFPEWHTPERLFERALRAPTRKPEGGTR